MSNDFKIGNARFMKFSENDYSMKIGHASSKWKRISKGKFENALKLYLKKLESVKSKLKDGER